MNTLVMVSLVLVPGNDPTDFGAYPERDIPRMVQRLKSPRFDVRYQAVQQLGHMGPRGQAAIPPLIEVLKTGEVGEMRFAAAQALGKMGATARPALPALREALKDEDRLVHVFVAEALYRIDPELKDLAVSALIEALRVSRKEPGEVPPPFVFGALRRLGSNARAAEVELMATLKERDLQNRLQAMLVLENLGTNRPELVPLLSATLLDRNYDQLAEAFQHTGTCFLLPLLTGQLDRSRSECLYLRNYYDEVSEYTRLNRVQAAELLGRMGPRANSAIPVLQAMKDDPYPAVREAASQALKKIQSKH